ADRNRSHWSTSKTPSYTKSVSWQHHLLSLSQLSGIPYPVFLGGVIISAHLTIIKFNNKYRVCYDRIFLYPQEYALPYCL
ncbi:hypothetical protein, partial [Escherichia coli]|uniref:hypothetical protein n=1 Tax=Escherichia coli TaxID=562 RepID=UPI003FA149B0